MSPTVPRKKRFKKGDFDFDAVIRAAALGFTSVAKIAYKLGYTPQQIYNVRRDDPEFADTFDAAVMVGHTDGEEKILKMMWQAADEGESWAIRELGKRLAPLPKPEPPEGSTRPAITLEVNIPDSYLEDRKREALASKHEVVVEANRESDV